jgi:HSP20 family protein
MSLVRYTRNDPFLSIFDDFFPTSTYKGLPTFATDRRVRVQNFDDRTEISVAAPGLVKKAFHVDLASNVLTVRYATEEGADAFFTQNSFSRSWRVDRDTTAEDITAAYENGVLVVTVGKVPGAENVTTTITVN